jgi:hypothetical protein
MRQIWVVMRKLPREIPRTRDVDIGVLAIILQVYRASRYFDKDALTLQEIIHRGSGKPEFPTKSRRDFLEGEIAKFPQYFHFEKGRYSLTEKGVGAILNPNQLSNFFVFYPKTRISDGYYPQDC